jgi:hypothetical protein
VFDYIEEAVNSIQPRVAYETLVAGKWFLNLDDKLHNAEECYEDIFGCEWI